MTNREKIIAILNPREDQIKIYGAWVEIEIQKLGINFSCELDWWNAEYQEPTTKNNLGVREFEEIEVTYPPEESCTYPKYKGKPYFGIKYKENGEHIVGYGTYSPEVLSRYLKDYFIPTTKNNLAVDCIDRELLIEWLIEWDITPIIKNPLIRHIQGMSSVIPIRPKGHWIRRDSFLVPYKCSECNFESERRDNFCPNCGSRNEVEE